MVNVMQLERDTKIARSTFYNWGVYPELPAKEAVKICIQNADRMDADIAALKEKVQRLRAAAMVLAVEAVGIGEVENEQ